MRPAARSTVSTMYVFFLSVCVSDEKIEPVSATCECVSKKKKGDVGGDEEGGKETGTYLE